MGKKKKAFEINFGTLLLIIIGICCIIFAFKNFSKEKTKAENKTTPIMFQMNTAGNPAKRQ